MGVEIYRNHKLTRDGMRAIHAEGGSVMYQGHVILPGQKLPDEATLAAGDEQLTLETRQALEAQLRALQDQLGRLGGHAPVAVATTDHPQAEVLTPGVGSDQSGLPRPPAQVESAADAEGVEVVDPEEAPRGRSK